jgi:hypothetical protein
VPQNPIRHWRFAYPRPGTTLLTPPSMAVNKAYVDANQAPPGEGGGVNLPGTRRFVNATGDAMTGPLLLVGDPTEDGQAATKAYIDETIANAVIDAQGGGTRASAPKSKKEEDAWTAEISKLTLSIDELRKGQRQLEAKLTKLEKA